MENFDKKDKFKISPYTFDGYQHIVDEEIENVLIEKECIYSKNELNEIIEEYGKPIDLISFKPKKSLEPHVWIDGRLNSQIRLQLLDIAYDFISTLNINWSEPKDIILTGSLANYNWSEFSDFDLHIIMEFSKIDERVDFVNEYLYSKKKDWNASHSDLNLYGYPVELYVQDINSINNSSGIYSLFNNKWIKKPKKDNIKSIKLDKFLIKEKSLNIINKTESFEIKVKQEEDKVKLKKILKEINNLIDKIGKMRKYGLLRSGEMDSYNIIFKVIRRLGFLKKIFELKNKIYDKIMSL